MRKGLLEFLLQPALLYMLNRIFIGALYRQTVIEDIKGYDETVEAKAGVSLCCTFSRHYFF